MSVKYIFTHCGYTKCHVDTLSEIMLADGRIYENIPFVIFHTYFTALSLLINAVVVPNPHYHGYTANSIPFPKVFPWLCPHSCSITTTIVPITRVNTAVLPQSPCQSLLFMLKPTSFWS